MEQRVQGKERIGEIVVSAKVEMNEGSELPLPQVPDWIAAENMDTMPMGWYWAEFPGGWEFFKPARLATLGIDHGHNGWQPLRAKRYWGPFKPPGVN
jgi:hypothetical protein